MFLSKWFYYAIFGIVLVIILVLLLVTFGIVFEDLALNLYSEIFGLLFTLIAFVGVLEIRERLEWKKIKKKVMKRIGRQIQAIFSAITDLCVIDFPIETFESNTYREEELEALLTKKIILRDSWKEKERSLVFAHIFESHWKAIGIIDSRHGKYLSPEVQCSLLDIEDSLHKVLFEFYATDFIEKDREEIIITEFKKIVKEIDYLRKNGIDTEF